MDPDGQRAAEPRRIHDPRVAPVVTASKPQTSHSPCNRRPLREGIPSELHIQRVDNGKPKGKPSRKCETFTHKATVAADQATAPYEPIRDSSLNLPKFYRCSAFDGLSHSRLSDTSIATSHPAFLTPAFRSRDLSYSLNTAFRVYVPFCFRAEHLGRRPFTIVV